MGRGVLLHFIKKNVADPGAVKDIRHILIRAVGQSGMTAGHDQGPGAEAAELPGMVLYGVLFCKDTGGHIES